MFGSFPVTSVGRSLYLLMPAILARSMDVKKGDDAYLIWENGKLWVEFNSTERIGKNACKEEVSERVESSKNKMEVVER